MTVRDAIKQLEGMPPDMQLVIWSFNETWQFATGAQVEDIQAWEYGEAMQNGNDFYDDPPAGHRSTTKKNTLLSVWHSIVFQQLNK